MLFLNTWVSSFLHLTMQQQEIIIHPLKTEMLNTVMLSSYRFLFCLTWEQGLRW